MFINKKADAKVEAAKMASLSIAWGIVAGIAYFGLIKVAVDALAKATSGNVSVTSVDSGLLHLNLGQFGGANASIYTAVLVALPFAIGAVLALGILARIRPGLPAVPGVLIVAALLGLAGSVLLFLAQVVNEKNGTEFVIALITIVLVSVLLRLQKFVRRFYHRTPAGASLVFTLVTLAYLLLASGVNVTSIILSQVDIWLSIIAFVLAFYSSVKLARLSRRMRLGK